MKLLRILVFFVLVSSIFSQASPTASQTEKEKKQKELEKQVLQMIDQAIGDAGTLKLARNRAIVFAIAGDLVWKFDEKRGRELFRNSANDIIVSNQEEEKDKKDDDDPYAEVFDFSGIRNEILPLVAKHDADFALELLVQTRPAKLTEAIAKASKTTKTDSGMFSFNPDQYRVRAEVALEQRFAIMAADQNPDKAIKLIKDSLSKGVSWNVLPMLQKLNKKDEKKASELASDIVKTLIDTDLTKNNENFGAALGFLDYATNPNAGKNTKDKRFKFTETQLKDLANKIVASFMQPGNSLEMTMGISRAIPALEKILPEKVALLKQKQADAMKNLPPELRRMERSQKIWSPSSTPEEILGELPKMEGFDKVNAYQSLVEKISKIEDETRAKKLIDQIPDEKTREKATDRYESEKINRASKDGKLDEAKSMIGKLAKKKTQIQKLVALAMEFQKKNTEKDQATAISLMKDAKALTNESPEDEDEINDLMEIVKGYAIINPNEAFRLFDPVVDQINDFVQASAILSKYNKRNRNFKKGELLMRVSGNTWDGQLLYRYVKQIQMLGKADLNKMSSLADRFQRSDSRSLVKLFIARGFFEDEKDKEEDNMEDGGIFFEFEG